MGGARYRAAADEPYAARGTVARGKGRAGQRDRRRAASAGRGSPGTLRRSGRSALRGWRASVNGVPTPVTTSDHALLAVELPTSGLPPEGGAYQVEWTYEQPGLAVGTGIALVTALLLALDALMSLRGGRIARNS